MKYVKALSMLLIMVLLTGCIKEDLDDCVRAQVYFRYCGDNPISQANQIFDKKIKRLDLYVYDASNNELVQVIPLEGKDLAPLKIRFKDNNSKLRNGKTYNLIAIGNKFENTEVINANSTTRNQIRMGNPHYFKGEFTQVATNDSLYYGFRQLAIPSENKLVYDTMNFESQHIKVMIDVLGMAASAKQQESPYADIAMANVIATADFDNTIEKSEKCTYFPNSIYTKNQQQLKARFNIFRFGPAGAEPETDGVTVDLVDENDKLYHTVGLTDFLRDNSAIIDSLKKNEAKLPMQINISGANISVTVPDWAINNVKPGIK